LASVQRCIAQKCCRWRMNVLRKWPICSNEDARQEAQACAPGSCKGRESERMNERNYYIICLIADCGKPRFYHVRPMCVVGYMSSCNDILMWRDVVPYHCSKSGTTLWHATNTRQPEDGTHMHQYQRIYGVSPTSADAILKFEQDLLVATAVTLLPPPHLYGMPMCHIRHSLACLHNALPMLTAAAYYPHHAKHHQPPAASTTCLLSH
jgi:hypothetical protein